jgi:hypothetical protein
MHLLVVVQWFIGPPGGSSDQVPTELPETVRVFDFGGH